MTHPYIRKDDMMRYINTNNIPHFALPKEIFTIENTKYLTEVYNDLYNKRLDNPPFEELVISSYMGDEKSYFMRYGDNPPETGVDGFSREDFNLLFPVVVHAYDIHRTSDGDDLNRVFLLAKIYLMTPHYGTILYDTEKNIVVFSDGKPIPMTEKDRFVALETMSVALTNLTALLYLKAEQRPVTKLLPKQGTSAQRRKAPDRYATEIQLEFTPELKRIISERSETINKGSGGTKNPHMRRGFIKTQRYGPKLSKVKEIFIEAVHVNKDKGPSTPKQTYRLKVTDQKQELTVQTVSV